MDPPWISALAEPETAADALVERPVRVRHDTPWPRLAVNNASPMKVCFVKPVAIDRQPSEERVHSLQRVMARRRESVERESSERPPRSYVCHIWVIGGVVQPAPVLDLAVNSNSERGLLSLVLDPNFATNHFIYISYTVGGASSTVSRYFPAAADQRSRSA